MSRKSHLKTPETITDRTPPPRTRYVRAALLALVIAAGGALRAQDAPEKDAKPDGKDAEAAKKEAPSPAAKRFAELRNLYRKDPAKAAEGFEAFLREYPNDEWADDAQYWLAKSLERDRQKRRETLAAYQTLIDKYPKSAYREDALFAIAETWRDQARRVEDVGQAVRAYQEFIEKVPHSERVAEAKLKIGELYYNAPLRNYPKAAEYFRRVAEEHPKSPYAGRARMRLATAHLALKEPDKALKIYETLLTEDLPQRQRIAVQLGMVDVWLGETPGQVDGAAKAEALCETIRAEAREKKSLEDFTEYRTREKMAQYCLRRKEYDKAEAEYQGYIERFGKSVGVWQAKFNIGTIRRAAGKHEAARAIYLEVIAPHRNDLAKAPWYAQQAMYYMGHTWEDEKNLDEARKVYVELSKAAPQNTWGKRAADRVQSIDKVTEEAKKKAEEERKKKDADAKKQPTPKALPR